MSRRLSHVLRHLSSASGSLSSVAAQSTMAAPSTSAAIRNAARPLHTAACLIIGDEVLGGKTKDTNSTYMAQWCFSLGVTLKRIEVIEDDESQISEAVRRMSDKYDFVVTSGGIGPTHDDITYPSIAKAFGLQLKLYQEAYDRMRALAKIRPPRDQIDWDVDSPQLRARLRMVELPTDPALPPERQFLFISDDLWVPVCVVNGNVHILPGIPRLFEMLLDGLKPALASRLASPDGKGLTRVLISTPLPESLVASYLTELAARVEPKGVKVGSYPRWNHKHNTVTLVGKDAAFIESLVPEVVDKVQGQRVSQEDENDEEGEGDQ